MSKLVRDRIPDLIRASGAEPITHQATAPEYTHQLRAKLQEEVDEFLDADPAGAVEELADIIEVVYALAADLGATSESLDATRATKAAERGAFSTRTIWSGNR
ncbi:nucleoside triphosphate pyrophosphohydrolase [Kribbella solani]|uniref:nucleoside triphosphate pyrophosphohydrolase n=1 Tax=Kribbella solani TaxID=236067 RepID=UPI0029BDDF88|nr:nucleoside triphosphate pyrophosphohydrolase [Kribbella solani]MDX2972438.1 nucleoside triphosphate pyrophosphohydrolase [Kribbella solani]MDX3004124.1 nucleoside triphosphate pyrophosphohydrolase [Kribbella solani]